MIYIDDLLGIPYKKSGRSKFGMDCIGLVIEVEKRFGNIIPDIEEYRATGSLNEFQTLVEKTSKNVKVELVDEPKKEGDIILFKNKSGALHHIAVYMGNGRFIHCNKFGVHIEKIASFDEEIGRCYTWLQ